ncbi:hypothetical protein [Rickettsiella massiliensis]|uniref:hypothetical protein n=1 Tax=Rickettsiella massiliensis TaxID=676517 RepID=UPI00029AFAE6|nr:hypothetical protein [Rickettsiella massiliensis]
MDEQKKYQQQIDDISKQIIHLDQLLELKEKSKEGLVLLGEYYSFLERFPQKSLGVGNFSTRQIYEFSKKESELIESFESGILDKIEELECYLKFIPEITENIHKNFRDSSFAKHLSFSLQLFFLCDIYPSLESFRNSLIYDQYDLDRTRCWLQKWWLKNLEVKEDYLLVGLLLLVVCKVTGEFFKHKPIHSQIDKLIKYTELTDYFLAEERLTTELYTLKGKLNEVRKDSIFFSQRDLDFSREKYSTTIYFY